MTIALEFHASQSGQMELESLISSKVSFLEGACKLKFIY